MLHYQFGLIESINGKITKLSLLFLGSRYGGDRVPSEDFTDSGGWKGSTCNINEIKLKKCIGRGRYGDVWKATMKSLPVAVKLFTAPNESFYKNECEIYRYPLMDHWALTKFYGSHEGSRPQRASRDETNDSDSEAESERSESTNASTESVGRCLTIVMSYVSGGSLMQYLKENTVDFQTLSKMSHSIAAGLAHIHSDITKNGEFILLSKFP